MLSSMAAMTCLHEFQKYADTVAVSSAIYDLFEKEPALGLFVGEENKLRTDEGNLLTPDLTFRYNNDLNGLLFELKYTLPSHIQDVKDTLLDLKKYLNATRGWRTPSGRVDSIDIVLVCCDDDVPIAVKAIKELVSENVKFFDNIGFALWAWMLTPVRSGEREERMRLQRIYGKTRNAKLEERIGSTGGTRISEDVLRYLRWLISFIRQKPPVQYTMHLLIQNIFPSLRSSFRSNERVVDAPLDIICQRCTSFFPPWWEPEVDPPQIRRGWLKEAMNSLVGLKIIEKVPDRNECYSIPFPTFKARKSLPQRLCELLALSQRKKGKRGRPRIKPARYPSRSANDRLINNYL